MMRLTVVMAALAAAFCLAACGEKPQTNVAGKNDVASFKGTEGAYMAPGWKPGDRTSWEQGLKARMWNSQNEYSKMNANK